MWGSSGAVAGVAAVSEEASASRGLRGDNSLRQATMTEISNLHIIHNTSIIFYANKHQQMINPVFLIGSNLELKNLLRLLSLLNKTQAEWLQLARLNLLVMVTP